MTSIAISRSHFPVTTLGPGRRVGIWFQGCSIRCSGCISPDTWAFGTGRTNLAQLLDRASTWLGQADGITISGGEPFDQPEALKALLTALRPGFDGDIFIYSGYPLEGIEPHLADMDGLIDALMTDPYVCEADDRLPLRGSDNQRLHLLTDRGRRAFGGCDRTGVKPRALDLMLDADGTVWLAGIPRRGDFAALAAILEGQGHRALIGGSRKGAGS